jgi:hypothetical protein
MAWDLFIECHDIVRQALAESPALVWASFCDEADVVGALLNCCADANLTDKVF